MNKSIRSARQAGVTLIELMVGLVIGLVAVLIISQVLSAAEARRRTNESGSDAQVSGAVGLHMLQRDIQSSGYGVAAYAPALGCAIRARYNNATDFSWTAAPVVITGGTSSGNGFSDTLQIAFSTRTGYSTPTRIAADHGQSATSFTVDSHIGVLAGDILMAVPETWSASQWCTILEASAAGSANVVSHASASTMMWNPSDPTTLLPSAGYPAGGRLVNLGTLALRSYSVADDGSLMLTSRTVDSSSATADVDGSSQSVVASNIVLLKAFYGMDTDGDGKVDTFTRTTPTTVTDWQRVLSVRIAVVARADQQESMRKGVSASGNGATAVTTVAPEWQVGSAATFNVSADTTLSAPAACSFNASDKCISLDVSHLSNWQYYRYKVFDTVVPLRNVLWGNT